MTLINIFQVEATTGLTQNQLHDLMINNRFPKHLWVVDNHKQWSVDQVRIWLKINNRTSYAKISKK